MDIFGLTPIDSALAAWGLNISTRLSDFLFIQTPIGVLAFAIGFLYAVFQSAREANFKYFVIFVFISLAGTLLFIVPQRQQSVIKSASEIYGRPSAITAQVIKNSQTNDHSMPLLLSFFAQMIDSISFGAINRVDESLNSQSPFLSDPFKIQKISLQANGWINSPITDVVLRQDVDDFIYAQYLPSLIMRKDIQWSDIQARLTSNPQCPLGEIKSSLSALSISHEHIDDEFMTAIIHGQCSANKSLWLKWAGGIQALFPYAYGWGNFCLYVSFPFLILALVVFRRMNLFFQYIEIFFWIKSWILCAAAGFYISLFALRIQGQTSSGINWFWDYPWYLAVGSIFLILMPILTFIGIHQSFQFINRS